MFFKNRNSNQPHEEVQIKTLKKLNWLKASIIVNIVLISVAGIVLASGQVIHQSDTNPEFCGSCHIMQNNVQSYLSGNTLDNVHAQANIQCKGCHDYPVAAEIKSGINYITGNYAIISLENPTIPKKEYRDEMCLECHISLDYLATQTDFLERNPHLSHWDNLKCSDCHISHGEQINYCDQCHDNGGQRMTGQPVIPRADNPWIIDTDAANESATSEN